MVLSVSKIQLNIMYCCHYLITAKRVNGGSLNATLMWSPKPNVKITLIKTTLNLCDLLREPLDVNTELRLSCTFGLGDNSKLPPFTLLAVYIMLSCILLTERTIDVNTELVAQFNRIWVN